MISCEIKRLLPCSIWLEFLFTQNSLSCRILSRIGFLSDYDVKYTNDKLQGILDNLKVEPSFALSYMAIPLKEMNKISVTARKQFIADVKSLVEKYAAADSPQESVELYWFLYYVAKIVLAKSYKVQTSDLECFQIISYYSN